MKTTSVRLLLIEDDADDARLLIDDLVVSAAYRFAIEWVDTLDAAHAALDRASFDVVITDLNLGATRGLETLFSLRARHPEVPIVVVSGHEDAPTAIIAMKNGAQDFLVKGDADRERITRAIAYAMERHRLECALRRQTEEMRAFTYAVTHDLRTPIISIDFLVEELKEELAARADPRAGPLLSAIEDRITSMERLIDDIHTISRADADDREEVLALPDLLHDVLETHQEAIRARGIELRLDVADMPPFRASRNQMTHLLGNIVGNAIKYTRDNGGVVAVRARAVGGSGPMPVWRIEVEDNGPGVAPEHRSTIFQPFARAPDRLGRQVPGSGLGLAIAAKVAHHIGSWIHLRDAAEGGALFTFDMPHARLVAPRPHDHPAGHSDVTHVGAPE